MTVTPQFVLLDHQVDAAPAKLVIRHPYIGETIPSSLQTGFERCWITPEWCWLADRDGVIEGALFASGSHAIVVLLRVAILPWAMKTTLLSLLRQAIIDCADRNFGGWLVCLDPDMPMEKRLMRLVGRFSGQVAGKGILMGGMICPRQ